jgi:phosphatidylserine decarboxylase
MGTPAGVFAFLREDINLCFRAMLNEYNVYLDSPDSTSVLTEDEEGWLNQTARNDMAEVVSEATGTTITFEEAFNCEPDQPAYGYVSWDDFFIRTFRTGVRDVFDPENGNIIDNACESQPRTLVRGVKLEDKFWLKEQPYSLQDILAGNEKNAQAFVGGTIYQAFLSALSYHRWHSPVTGTIVGIEFVPGSYYAENYWEGFAYTYPSEDGTPPVLDPDPAAPDRSQGYICQVATRALIYILADNPAIGLMCVVEVGMAEVSTCEVTVNTGQKVNKGDQIGMVRIEISSNPLYVASTNIS